MINKIEAIKNSRGLMKKITTLMLLGCKDIGAVFDLTEEELAQFKREVFNPDRLVERGRIYIIDYLERSNQGDVLDMFLKGETYAKMKMGITWKLVPENRSELYGRLVDDTLLKSCEEPSISTRLKSIVALKSEITVKSAEDVLDKIEDLLKEKEIDL